MTSPRTSHLDLTARSFGQDVLGPIVAEFCSRLWMFGSLLEHRDATKLLFCARGGLRMQLAYERFLSASELTTPLEVESLMISRLVAVRPALMRGVMEGSSQLPPAAAQTLAYEFPRSSVSEIARALTGHRPENSSAWEVPFTSERLMALLRHPDGRSVVTMLDEQTALFSDHLRSALNGHGRAILVDTGLFGTTQQLIAEGYPDIQFGSALIARSNYRSAAATHHARVIGLSLQADGYASWNRRSSMLRYWHFVESLFEPSLDSVKEFVRESGRPTSNLEVDGWQARVLPDPGSAFDGTIAYLDSLTPGSAGRVTLEADRAWAQFKRAVVWPDRVHGAALDAGQRTGDFGTTLVWTAREWQGPLAALRGSNMWREGEIARSGTRLRIPLLAAIETAYGARRLTRAVRRRAR